MSELFVVFDSFTSLASGLAQLPGILLQHRDFYPLGWFPSFDTSLSIMRLGATAVKTAAYVEGRRVQRRSR